MRTTSSLDKLEEKILKKNKELGKWTGRNKKQKAN